MSAVAKAAIETYPPPEYWECLELGGRNPFYAAAALLDTLPSGDPPAGPSPSLPDTEPDVLAVVPDMRDSGIMPRPFGGTRRLNKADLPLLEVGHSRPPFEPRLLGSLPAAQGTLRSKPWHGVPDIMVPNILIERGKGRDDDLNIAPNGLRLFIELLMLVPRRNRRGRCRLHLRVADLAGWLWPGTGRFRRDKHGPQLQDALVVAHNCRLPWTDGDSDGFWAPVVIRSAPDTQYAESLLVVDLEMPPGSHSGPMVYRPDLRRYGSQSAIAWRLTLALAWLWDHYLTGRRAPGMEKLPWLDNDGLIRLATGRDMSRVRKKERKHRLLLRSQKAVDRLYEDGNVRVEVDHDRGLIRLLPPADWRHR